MHTFTLLQCFNIQFISRKRNRIGVDMSKIIIRPIFYFAWSSKAASKHVGLSVKHVGGKPVPARVMNTYIKSKASGNW